MDDKEYLKAYTYTGLSGQTYHPYFKGGKWYICDYEVGFFHLAALLQIEDEEELTILRLTYGA